MSESRVLIRPLDGNRTGLALLLGTMAAAAALAGGSKTALVLALPVPALALGWWLLIEPTRWVSLFFAAALLLPPLPIPMGDSGPHPSLAVAALGLLIAAARLGEWRLRWTPLAQSMLLLFSVLLASVGFAALYSGPILAAASLARVCLFGISVFVFFYTAYGPALSSRVTSFGQARFLFWIATAAALFACLDFYYQFPAPAGFGPQFVWLDTGVYRRAQGLFYEASTLGNLCAFFLVMIATALLRPHGERPVGRAALLVGGALFSLALLFSYSRASLLNLAAACVALLFLHRERIRPGRLLIILLVCVAAGAAASYALRPEFTENYWTRLAGSVQGFFTETAGLLSGRAESWTRLAAFLAQHPWQLLFGIGYKTLPYTNLLGRPVVADNMYLSLLVETGVAGLGCLLLFNAAILAAGLRAARSLDRRRSFFGAWIFCFWVGQTIQMLSGDLLTYWRVLPVYLWVLALAVR